MKVFVKVLETERRFEADFNALGQALVLLGMDTMNGIVDVMQVRPSQFPTIASCCLNEGSRLEGSDWRISPERVGELPILTVMEMMNAYARQVAPDVTAVESKKDPPTV